MNGAGRPLGMEGTEMIDVTIELDDYYSGGWVYTNTYHTYYFDGQTDMVELIQTIIRDEENVGEH